MYIHFLYYVLLMLLHKDFLSPPLQVELWRLLLYEFDEYTCIHIRYNENGCNMHYIELSRNAKSNSESSIYPVCHIARRFDHSLYIYEPLLLIWGLIFDLE